MKKINFVDSDSQPENHCKITVLLNKGLTELKSAYPPLPNTFSREPINYLPRHMLP